MSISKNREIELSVLVPVYNEELNLQELYDRLVDTIHSLNLSYEIIFINDGSHDQTKQKLNSFVSINKSVFYIELSRNFGHQIAVSAGIDQCRGKFAIIIDADLQDPPEIIPQLIEKYKMGFQVVYAKRSERKGEGVFKKMTAYFFYRILRRISSVHIPVDVGDYRLIDRCIIDLLKQMPERNKFLRGQIAWLGFQQTFVEFERVERKNGNSAYSISKMVHLAIDAITGFSDKPLSFVLRMGIFISGISLFIIFYALYSHFILLRTITGWTSLIISSMFIGGVQLISIGIIGEYVSRINRNVQSRPLYVIQETNLPKVKNED